MFFHLRKVGFETPKWDFFLCQEMKNDSMSLRAQQLSWHILFFCLFVCLFVCVYVYVLFVDKSQENPQA